MNYLIVITEHSLAFCVELLCTIESLESSLLQKETVSKQTSENSVGKIQIDFNRPQMAVSLFMC